MSSSTAHLAGPQGAEHGAHQWCWGQQRHCLGRCRDKAKAKQGVPQVSSPMGWVGPWQALGISSISLKPHSGSEQLWGQGSAGCFHCRAVWHPGANMLYQQEGSILRIPSLPFGFSALSHSSLHNGTRGGRAGSRGPLQRLPINRGLTNSPALQPLLPALGSARLCHAGHTAQHPGAGPARDTARPGQHSCPS